MDFFAGHVGGGDERREGGKTELVDGIQQVGIATGLVYKFELEVVSRAADIDTFQASSEFQRIRGTFLLCRFLVVHSFSPLIFILDAGKPSKLSHSCHSYRLFPKYG